MLSEHLVQAEPQNRTSACPHPDGLGEIDTEADGDVVASFLLPDSPETRAVWPVAFLATLTIRVGGARLGVTLSVDNTGSDSLSFTAAVHTYLRVSDVVGR